MKCGIVGLPNVGKSTLFNALTKAGIAAENYPFCTIEPNVGVVEVPDRRLGALARIAQPQKVVPAVVEFVDDPEHPEAGFTLTPPFTLWRDILERRTLAATAILTGRLKVKGDRMLLLRHTAANRALIHCTASVDTDWN